MIKLIATIDSLRGMYCDPSIPSIEKYQSKIASRGSVRAPGSVLDSITHNYVYNQYKSVIWARNGLKIQKELLEYVDELYITQLDGNFNCISHFPSFENDFFMVSKGKIKRENDVLFQHQVWRSKKVGKYLAD